MPLEFLLSIFLYIIGNNIHENAIIARQSVILTFSYHQDNYFRTY